MRKNGAPPTFVLYTGFHYYGTPKNEFWEFSIEVIDLGLEFFSRFNCPNIRMFYLDPYIIGAILFLSNATPPTFLDLEG